jgi:hypothetical protein
LHIFPSKTLSPFIGEDELNQRTFKGGEHMLQSELVQEVARQVMLRFQQSEVYAWAKKQIELDKKEPRQLRRARATYEAAEYLDRASRLLDQVEEGG